MCTGAVIKVKCKHCLAKGLGSMELLEYELCDPPCQRSFTLLEWPKDTVAEREYCEICTPDFDEESESDEGYDRQVRVTRFDCGPDAETRLLDWREQGVYLASTVYGGHTQQATATQDSRADTVLGITQGGVSVEFPDPDEERATVQEQIKTLFQDFGKEFSTDGEPKGDFKCKETESGELVSPQIQWPCLGLFEEAEEDWMLIRSVIMTCA